MTVCEEYWKIKTVSIFFLAIVTISSIRNCVIEDHRYVWFEMRLNWFEEPQVYFWTFRFPVELENPSLDLGLQEISTSCVSQGYSKIQGQGLYLEIGLQSGLFMMMKNVQTKPNSRRLLALLNHLLHSSIPWRTLFLSCKRFVPHCHLAQPASAP